MKFGYMLLEKPNIARLKPAATDLLLDLVFHQDNAKGIVDGVHYRDVVQSTGRVKQSFYNALQELQEAGVIECEYHADGSYFTVQILDNSFPAAADLKRGYINLQKEVFHSTDFKTLKAPEKYLVLYLYKRTHEKQQKQSFEIHRETLITNLTELFSVSERTVQSYLHSMRKFFSIGIKNGKYFITYKASRFKKKIEKPERLVRDEQYIRLVVHRLKIRAATSTEISHTAELLQQYKQMAKDKKKDLKKVIFELISDIVMDKLQKNRNLPFKLLNHLLGARLAREEDSADSLEKKLLESQHRKWRHQKDSANPAFA